ncbi:MAG: hypothetical protein K2N13_08100 [Paraprevotella sp.]|nr:hypothetical protein [Paraprevotella sp.]
MSRIRIKWLGITVVVMFVLPFVVARCVSECAGMACCMLLFLVINPFYSIKIGSVAGKCVKRLWSLPVLSAAMFLAGVWVFFTTEEPWFLAYAGVYLAIGLVSMAAVSLYLNGRCGKS